MPEHRCDTCRHWRRTDQGELTDYESKPPHVSDELDDDDPAFVAIGECRRFPPQLIESIMCETERTIEQNHGVVLGLAAPAILLSGSRWPVTWEMDCCGEWQTA